MPFRGFAKKVFRRGRKYAKKRYVRKGAGYGTGLRLNKIRKDIMTIKRDLNTEKKYYEVEAFGLDCAQVSYNASGYVVQDLVNGHCSQGVAYNQRVGNSIKITGMVLQTQFVGQTAQCTPMKMRVMIIEDSNNEQSMISSVHDMWDVNPLSNIIDYNSNRQQQTYKNFRIHYNKVHYLKAPYQTNTDATSVEDRRQAIRLSHHVKFNHATTTALNGRLLLLVMADIGNSNAANSPTPNIPITVGRSGCTFSYHTRIWYVDN